jgi:hypothetical protein
VPITPDPNKVYFWGYLHSNGRVQTKRWFGDHADYTSDCQGNPFVLQVVPPFVAENRDIAEKTIIEELKKVIHAAAKSTN